MNTLLQQLIELTGRLATAAGAAADSLASLRRFLAAWLIQQNPGFAPVVADPEADPELMQAAREGEALAAELNAAGSRLRWRREPYLAVESQAERARDVFGPFVDDELALVQFAFFENARFVVVVSHLETPFFEIREPVLLLPADSAPDAADPLRWNLPAGTVWLRAERLAAGAQGFAALRISGGVFNAGAVLPPPAPDGTLLVPIVAPWTLSVEPEPAPAADAAGSDGNALAIELPLRLELGNGVAPVISGALGLAGFGDALRFTTQAGAPVIGGDAIAFPFDTAGATWGIAGNRSPLCQVEGSAEVAAAVWSLPLSKAPLEEAGRGRARRLGCAAVAQRACSARCRRERRVPRHRQRAQRGRDAASTGSCAARRRTCRSTSPCGTLRAAGCSLECSASRGCASRAGAAAQTWSGSKAAACTTAGTGRLPPATGHSTSTAPAM